MLHIENEKNIRRKWLYYISLLYILFVLIRPHEFLVFLKGIPIMPILVITGLLLFPYSHDKRSGAIQSKLLIVFVLFMSISIIVSGWIGGLFVVIVDFLPLVLLYFFISDSCDSSKKTVLLMSVIVFSAIFMAVHGIYQVEGIAGWSGAVLIKGRISYIGILGDPNDLGMFFVISTPFCVYFIQNTKKKMIKIIYLVGLLIILYGIVLTVSRGAILAVGALSGLYILKRYGPFVTGIAAIIFLSILLTLSSRLSEIDAGEESAQGRVEAWYEGFQMLISHPIFGVGPGNFTNYNYLTAHNSYILILAELGVIGYIIWVCFWGVTLNMGYDSMAKLKAHAEKADATVKENIIREYNISMALTYALIGFLVPAFFLSRSYNVLLYILCAVLVAHYFNLKRAYPDIDFRNPTEYLNKFVMYSLLSLVVMYFVVKILLMYS